LEIQRLGKPVVNFQGNLRFFKVVHSSGSRTDDAQKNLTKVATLLVAPKHQPAKLVAL